MVEAKKKELAVIRYKELYDNGSRDIDTLYTENELKEQSTFIEELHKWYYQYGTLNR